MSSGLIRGIRVVIVRVRRVEEVHGAQQLVFPCRHPVVEDGNFPKVRIPQGDVVEDPVAVVLVVKLLVLFGAHAICCRVAPTPQERSRVEVVVIDDPQLIEGGDTDHQMLKERIEINGIDVQPIARLRAGRAMVEVDEGGVFADGAEVGFGAVKTLHQVVPCMPFPDDVRTS